MGKVIDTTDIKPPVKPKRKRKTRSDKGVSRKEPKHANSKVVIQPSKYLFDEHVINDRWWMKVNYNLCQKNEHEAYVLEFMLGGVRYTYRQYFADPTLAYAVGVMCLNMKKQGMVNVL